MSLKSNFTIFLLLFLINAAFAKPGFFGRGGTGRVFGTMGLIGGYNMFAGLFDSGPEIIFDNSSEEEEATNVIAQRPPAPQGYYTHGPPHGPHHGNHHGHYHTNGYPNTYPDRYPNGYNEVGYSQPGYPRNGYAPAEHPQAGQRQPSTNPYHQRGNDIYPSGYDGRQQPSAQGSNNQNSGKRGPPTGKHGNPNTNQVVPKPRDQKKKNPNPKSPKGQNKEKGKPDPSQVKPTSKPSGPVWNVPQKSQNKFQDLN